MTQAELADRLDRNRGWVSKKLSGPTNWTLRTFGDLVDALDGEVEISIADLRGVQELTNFDAYAGYGEEPIERRETTWEWIHKPEVIDLSGKPITIEKPIGTNGTWSMIEYAE